MANISKEAKKLIQDKIDVLKDERKVLKKKAVEFAQASKSADVRRDQNAAKLAEVEALIDTLKEDIK